MSSNFQLLPEPYDVLSTTKTWKEDRLHKTQYFFTQRRERGEDQEKGQEKES